jgi:hypothetical protein
MTKRRAIGLAAGAVALVAFLSPLAATASATTTADSIASAFTPTSPTAALPGDGLIGVGGTATLSYTITDSNSSGTDTNVGFTDTLPPGLVVDTPNGDSVSCGTSPVLTANPGTDTITLTGGNLKGGAAGASGTTCAISVNVTSNTPNAGYVDTPGAVTSSDGTGAAGAPVTLAVAGNPTVTVTSPKNNSTFNYGQKVTVTYSCAEGEFGPGLVDCSASDDNGNTINSGGTIDTTVTGTGQQIAVDATSGDGLVIEDNINYTVLPSNVFTVVKTSAGKNGVVTLKLKLPGAGKLAVGEKVDGKAFSSYAGKIKGAKTVTITLKPSSAGAKLLKKLAKENHPPKLTGKLSIAYTPTGGKKKTATVGGIKLKI